MESVENILFWATIFVYVAVFILALFEQTRGGESDRKTASRVLLLGLTIHTALCVVRWVSSGHPPVTDTYELNLTGTWFTILILLLFQKMRKVDRIVSLVVIPVVFLILGYGHLSGTDIKPMGPAFQSPWLIVHVIFAWLAFGFYALATGSSIFLLLKTRFPSRRSRIGNLSEEALDQNSYRFIVLGFINHAVMLVSGAIWAKKLWGHYWSWDPLETWSLIAFLYYAFYLHARSFLKWKMRRAAWLAMLGILILVVSFWGVRWFGPSPHPGP